MIIVCGKLINIVLISINLDNDPNECSSVESK